MSFLDSVGSVFSSVNDEVKQYAEMYIEYEQAQNASPTGAAEEIAAQATTPTTTKPAPNNVPLSAEQVVRNHDMQKQSSIVNLFGVNVDKNILMLSGGLLLAALVAKKVL
jgi:hypothetical protein